MNSSWEIVEKCSTDQEHPVPPNPTQQAAEFPDLVDGQDYVLSEDLEKLEDEQNQRPPISRVFKVKDVAYVLRYPLDSTMREKVKETAKRQRGPGYSLCSMTGQRYYGNMQCNACIERAGLYVRDKGPDGAVFFHGLEYKQPIKNRLHQLAEMTCAQCDVEPELVVVTDTTYKPAQEGWSREERGKPQEAYYHWTVFPSEVTRSDAAQEGWSRPEFGKAQEAYYHWTVFPSEVTRSDAAQRMERLKNYLPQMDTRLAKLTTPEAIESVKIMMEEQEKLQRPNHYRSVLDWVKGLQEAAVEGCSWPAPFEEQSVEDKMAFRVNALMTGRVQGSTHLDFHQAENIVDFLTEPSREALRATMDQRSDPAYYQISQFNRRLVEAGVTSKHMIGLVWEGQYTDDLDIHVTTPNGNVIYYGNTKGDGCQLDFDANVNKGEANPAENVSVIPGTYKVQVNNYTIRTRGKPVPFQIICRQAGLADQVYDSAWMPGRSSGEFITVCTHTFHELDEDDSTPEMSANAASRSRALDSEWNACVGTPEATVATLKSLREKENVDVVVCNDGASGIKENVTANQLFMQMANAQPKEEKKKQYLSENCSKNPSTIQELMEFVRTNPAAESSSTPEMSANAASRSRALDSEWNACVGTPEATVATLKSLGEKENVDVVVCSNSGGPSGINENVTANQLFMQMANALKPKKNNKKRYLSENCSKNPSTIQELMEFVRTNPDSRLTIVPRDHTPGYLVDIGTSSGNNVRSTDLPAPCHYQAKFQYPVKPVPGADGLSIGNARLDEAWFTESSGRSTLDMAGVGAIAKVGGMYFLAMRDGMLPEGGLSGEDYPLGGGFYPTDLKADYHKHRERWTFFHTQLKPVMPTDGSLPMIGTFLTGKSAVVYLDGVKMAVSL
eukprot:CAMPEP_0197865012 /NCGR_PEP_ID=MMETSP1438-20131217/43410_1 /TAXON_ID=1461541 /ORGANISM="Pterosperma sp., Strain CCMP1384" /LENGTH=897 /DNA_ID=CAMNT_0043483409 /DNA_START=152 /DNA_END=2845 /DNA_ORIENTATION=-